ncbi:RidA family protein [Seonamhaeicola aphaedonensis]|uniref:Enamine deaminase RidA (YjgF/YER057c/UK114 family) n=1 Tax=Seonamhaeicola aphaedonensis TaxID=1461338 RepID=A0A3D9HDH7_9FLAO|nr:RidA family protein [Seonamhaeicola aphaedonensis]RED47515.1 enamine deaminase RidA (YjgF/YER057c/UK114 family) [Seonamhaeicola aphaedonensis]
MTKKVLRTKLTLLVLALQTATSLVYGQEIERQHMAKLSFLIGNWTGNSYSFAKNDTTKVKVSESANYILDGNAITLDVNSSSVQLHTVITYSVNDSCYYYQPTSKTESYKKSKGYFIDGKFLVYFNPKNRLNFEKTKSGEFHEYGETLKNGIWEKYFEDILEPAPSNYSFAPKKEKITKEYIDPIKALTNVVSVEHENFKNIYIAGQVGTGKTKEEQLETAYKAIEKRLSQAGASFSDLVEMKIYIVDYDPEKDLDMFFRVREKLYGERKMPPNVFIGISSLYSKEKLIELSGTAVLIK